METGSGKECQLTAVPSLAEPVPRGSILWQLRKRIKRMAKRRWIYLSNLLKAFVGEKSSQPANPSVGNDGGVLRAGDVVRIRSRKEIEATLSNWNTLKGCAMMEEMWEYCGTRHRVMKRVERFLDERDYLMKKTHGIVILDGVICAGTVDFGPCDRSCFFFWREEWLEKISDEPGATAPSRPGA